MLYIDFCLGFIFLPAAFNGIVCARARAYLFISQLMLSRGINFLQRWLHKDNNLKAHIIFFSINSAAAGEMQTVASAATTDKKLSAAPIFDVTRRLEN